MTSSDRSRLSLLAARDERQQRLTSALRAGRPATVFLSLNIPGSEKVPAGAPALFASVVGQLALAFSDSAPDWQALDALDTLDAFDALGPYAIVAVDGDPFAIKRRCIEIETGAPAARLIDLDVYTAAGVQVDRQRLGLPPRSCLVCPLPAVDCISNRRHSFAEVVARSHELLSPFRT